MSQPLVAEVEASMASRVLLESAPELENDPASKAPAKVKVKVWMEPAASPVYASAERRALVIVISGLVFIGIVTFSARRIISSVRRGPE